MDVGNIFLTKLYEIKDTEKLPMIKWLRKEGLQFIQTLEQEAYETIKKLFNTLSEKFKQQHNKTILTLQYCKLVWHSDESAEEWMDTLRVMAIECKYKE